MKSRDAVSRLKRFEVEEKQRKVAEIETMIGDFGQMAQDLDRQIATAPATPRYVYGQAVALDVLDARARVTHMLERAGATVLEAPAGALPAACVHAYLRAKARARMASRSARGRARNSTEIFASRASHASHAWTTRRNSPRATPTQSAYA